MTEVVNTYQLIE